MPDIVLEHSSELPLLSQSLPCKAGQTKSSMKRNVIGNVHRHLSNDCKLYCVFHVSVHMVIVSTWKCICFLSFLYPVMLLYSFILEVSGKFLGVFYVDVPNRDIFSSSFQFICLIVLLNWLKCLILCGMRVLGANIPILIVGECV